MPISKSKQFFFALNTDDTDEFLDTNKGFYREMWNMVPGNEVTSNPSRQPMKSNGSIGIDFNSQENNVCIGTATDTGRNRIAFFVYKPFFPDAIYLWESGKADATKIFSWEGLNFSEEETIEHAFIIDDLLYWTQKNNIQRCINIKRALAGDYIGKEFDINLAKKGPIFPPTAEKTNSLDGSLTINKISHDNYQFSYRYKYKDGIYSPISPYSKLILSDLQPSYSNSNRAIELEIQIPVGIEDYVDEIEILVDANKLNIWRIFETLDNVDTSGASPGADFVTWSNIIFDNQKHLITLSEEDQEKLFEPIPKRSSTQAFIKNRNVINNYLNGYDDDGNYDMVLNQIINNDDNTTEYDNQVSANNFKFHFKAGGSYSAALVFYDEFHRITTVKKTVPINIPFDTYNVSGNTNFPTPKRHIAELGFTGTPPSYAKYYSIALSREKNYELYMQIPVTFLYYIADFQEGDTYPSEAFVYDGAVYLDSPPGDFSGSLANFIHLLMPKNIPFTPENGFIVKILDDDVGIDIEEESVIEIIRNKMVVGDFGRNDWSSIKGTMYVEVYKAKQGVSEEFFEQGQVFPIDEFGTSRWIEGDTSFILDNNLPPEVSYIFSYIPGSAEGLPSPSNSYTADFTPEFGIVSESPTKTYTSSRITTQINAKIESEEKKASALEEATTINLGKYKVNLIRGFAYQFFTKPPPQVFVNYESFSTPPSKTLDYRKEANNHGRTIIKLDEEEEFSSPNLIIPSDVYVSDSKINGLHNFDPANSYIVPYDRGNIVKMVASNQVLVIIHERNITTMYPGESYVRQGQELTWTISDTFLTQDRQILGKLGSQNPESIISYDNRVYGLDLYNAEPWRLSNDGITPLASAYKVKRWFIERCRLYYQEDPLPKIPGGYDPYLDMYLLTFPEIGTHEAVTIGFSEKYDIWVGFYSFIPERYGFVSDNFLSFKNGIPYLHNNPNTSIRNRFYGTDHDSIIKFIVNDNYSQDKIFKALAIESDKRWKVDCNTPAGQSSRIPSDSFIKRGDHYVSDFYRDENTPTEVIPSGKSALLHGQEMSGPSIEITLTYTYNDDVRLRYVDTRYVVVSGSLLV